MLVKNPVNFQRFTCFYKSNESLQILSTIAQNESLKIEICESKSLQILKFWTRKSWFANPNLKDSFRWFVSWKQKSQITRFVSICKDSYLNPASLLPRLPPNNRSGTIVWISFYSFRIKRLKPMNSIQVLAMPKNVFGLQ